MDRSDGDNEPCSASNVVQKLDTAENSSERFDEGGFDDESQASYIYDSERSNSSVDTQDEKDYFGDSGVSADSESSGVAWVDSDEDNGLREDFQTSAAWLSTEGLTKNIQKKTKKISFKLSRKLFTSKHKIKLFRAFDTLKVAVDTFNVIYLIRGPDDFKAYKIDFFRITGFVYFSNRLLFFSSASSFLKELSLDGGVSEINKRTGSIRKMCVGDGLYIAADKLTRFDENLNAKEVFNHAFTDICANRRHVACLNANGDVFVFDPRLNLVKRHSFPGKFQFKGIFCTEENYFLSTEMGFCVLNDRFEIVREFTNLKSYATGLVSNDDFVVYGADYQNSLRILRRGLVCYDRFPFSKVWINPISCLDVRGDTVYFGHSKFVSSLKISYGE